jgi:hypothetical protein
MIPGPPLPGLGFFHRIPAVSRHFQRPLFALQFSL